MGALDGVLVVALEQAVAAPLCTLRLAEAGARVIKIERSTGDFARGYDTAAKGESSYFTWLNQGKESLVADIKADADAALLHRIIERADVFIQNLAPGATERAGFGSAELREKYPRLVTCDISGYGTDAAVRGLKAYDLLVQGESGLLAVSGPPGPYGRIGVSICDIGAGLTSYSAILEALIQRGTTGSGVGVAVSLFDVAAEWMAVPFVHYKHGEGAPDRIGVKHPSIAPYGAFTTKNNQDVIVAVQNEREWRRLCADVLRDTSLSTDNRFSSNTSRVSLRADLDHLIQSIVSTLTTEEFISRLEEASIAFGRINDLKALSDHKALRVKTVLNSIGDDVVLPARPIRSQIESENKIPPPPKLGEHTKSIYAEFSKH